MWEAKVVEHIELVTENDSEPDDRLGQELAQQCYSNVIVGHLQPPLRGGELQFRT